ncbi:MAG TPA: DUF2627 domain-containing protein [Candidatus Dormibacteraeota bacterium]|nr:DUF2627 domain-containing protein [Candidatus Dormibacteraeota bacterium]
MIRIIAIMILLIPGVFAAYGIKLMRDALFLQISPLLFNAGIQFIVGLILFIAGVGFIGGYVVHRDRKKNLVTRPKRRKY